MTGHEVLRQKLDDAEQAGRDRDGPADTPQDVRLIGGTFGTDLLRALLVDRDDLAKRCLVDLNPRQRRVVMEQARREFDPWWMRECVRFPMSERGDRMMEYLRVWLLSRGFTEDELPAT